MPNALSPASTLLRGTKATFSFTDVSALPRFAALVNQVNPPVYAPLTTSGTAAAGNASFVFPDSGVVVGIVYVSLVTSDTAVTLDGVQAHTVAGTFDVLVV